MLCLSRSQITNSTWSILEYFVPNVIKNWMFYESSNIRYVRKYRLVRGD